MLARLLRPLMILCGVALCGVPAAGGGQADEVIARDSAPRWWKGNLHTHTLWSDGNDFPEMVALWYRERGYHFLALSDHNVLSQGQKWMPLAEVQRRAGGPEAVQRYLHRFGPVWVERRAGSDGGGGEQVRLKPLGEVRAVLEERGRFLMIQSEEITDSFQRAPIHVNAANLLELIEPQGGDSVADTIERNLRAVEEQAARTGQEMLPHLNHPNFGWAVTAEDIAEAVSDRFFEIYNGHPGVNQPGDATRPSVERMWDIANTLRITRFGGEPLYGIATDDSHHYHDAGMRRSTPGRGWVMVRAAHLTPESLIRAMNAGDFYASSGVTLRSVSFSAETGELSIEIEPEPGATYTTRFVGTLSDADLTTRPAPTTQRASLVYSEDIGRTLASVEGTKATYRLRGSELYVRAIVTSSQPHENPSFEGQSRQAWTQPVGWRTGGNDRAGT